MKIQENRKMSKNKIILNKFGCIILGLKLKKSGIFFKFEDVRTLC